MSIDSATQARLVGLFVGEAEEALRALGTSHLRLAASQDHDELQAFGRTAHGLKGASSALGFSALASVLHDLEEVSLGLAGPASAARSACHETLGLALQRLEAGLVQMATAGLPDFPEEAIRAAAAALEGATSTSTSTSTPTPTSTPTDEVVERLSVPAADVDEALRLAASLARATAQLQGAEGDGGATQGLAARAERLEAIIAGLRLLPAEVALSGVEDEVAVLAERLGKQVVLSVHGREVRADRRTLQSARGTLRHLIRNALDHGIEPPGERLAGGKPAAGALSIGLASGDGALLVTVADDGAGFDVTAARQALVRRGEDPARLQALPEAEVLARFAAAGGSTRAEVTEVSGRGLGLSAVAALARAAGGAFAVRSQRGRGSSVTFSLPLDVYSVEVLVVSSCGRALGLPVQALERTVLLREAGEALQEGPTGRTLATGESILPLIGLADALGLPGHAGAERFALVVHGPDGALALAAEDVGAVVAVVPAAVPGAAGTGALVTGLARLADGSTVQVLDPAQLVAAARATARRPVSPRRAPADGLQEGPHPPPPCSLPPGPAAALAPRAHPGRDVVLAEDSLATREVLRVLLEEQGFRVRLAADGEEALARIREQPPDVLVTDVNMPRRDGLALTRAVRADPVLAGLPVILLTSQDDEATRAAGAQAGADAHLVKSRFGAEVLAATLSRIGLGSPR